MAEMQKPDEGAPPVVNKAYDFVLWLLPKVENFPRAHRFTVGDRLTANGLDLLTSLVEAAYAHSTRYLLRLAKDLRLLSVDSYGFSEEKLDEIGRMVGGWRKAHPGRA